MDPSKPPWKIRRVLRVKNSIEVLERFEEYRAVTILWHYIGLLQQKAEQVLELCKDPSVEPAENSRFDMEFTRKNVIKLSTSSEEESQYGFFHVEFGEGCMPVIVCRVVARRIACNI